MTSKNQALQMLEGPWIKPQVEGHLVFGLFARQIKLAWPLLALSIAYSIYAFFISGKSVGQVLFSDMGAYFYPFIAVMMFKFPKYHQAAIFWGAIKFTGGIVSFLFIVLSCVKFFQDSPEGPLMLALGLIWFPGIEFIPKMMPYQKLITICRVGASIPLFMKL